MWVCFGIALNVGLHRDSFECIIPIPWLLVGLFGVLSVQHDLENC